MRSVYLAKDVARPFMPMQGWHLALPGLHPLILLDCCIRLQRPRVKMSCVGPQIHSPNYCEVLCTLCSHWQGPSRYDGDGFIIQASGMGMLSEAGNMAETAE